MQHDVEAECESDDEEGVPNEEEEESGQNFVEHCHVDVVAGQARVTSHKRHKLGPE